MKDSDDFAYFMFYILEPLTAEKWQSRDYSGEAVSDFQFPSDKASLEYTFKLNILKADMVYVKDYNDLRLGVIIAMQDILRCKTKEELRDKAAMQTYIQSYVDDMLGYMQTPEVGVEIKFSYFPLSEHEEKYSKVNNAEEIETRMYSNGTDEDYHSLLALKTSN